MCLGAQMETEYFVCLSVSSQNGCRPNVVIDAGPICEDLDLLRRFLGAFHRVVLVFVHGDVCKGGPFRGVSYCLDLFRFLGVDREGGGKVVERKSVTLAESGGLSDLLMDGVGCGESAHSYEGAEGDALEWEGCDVGVGDCDFRGC